MFKGTRKIRHISWLVGGDGMNYFDLHCDTISECYRQKMALDTNHLQISLKKGSKLGKWIQVYAIWMDDALQGEEAYRHFMDVYEYFLQQVDYNKEKMTLCLSAKDVQDCMIRKERAAILAVEGSRALGGKLERVEEFYQKGIRLMTLTWNGRSEVGDGCMVTQAGGLTSFGEAVVAKMEALGMIIDVSHLSEKGFFDVVRLTKSPFIATHSNSQKVCPVPRNLTDEQFRLIVQRQGIVGMNFYPLFINGTLKCHIKELLPHIDHFITLGGENHICIGSDFDGARMPKDLRNLSHMTRLYHLLVERYGSQSAEKFMFGNAYTFFKKNLDGITE